MDYAKALAILLSDLQCTISELSEGEIDKVISGDYQFSLKIIKKRNTSNTKNIIKKDTNYEELLNLLNQCDSREKGIDILSNYLKNKSEYENFARHVEVAVMKSDKLEKIKDNIIESTVGAKIRSEAIQNKK